MRAKKKKKQTQKKKNKRKIAREIDRCREKQIKELNEMDMHVTSFIIILLKERCT